MLSAMGIYLPSPGGCEIRDIVCNGIIMEPVQQTSPPHTRATVHGWRSPSRTPCFPNYPTMFSQDVSNEWAVPDAVRKFVTALHRAITDRSAYEIADLYTVQYSKTTERFFKASPWPTADLIADIVSNDADFLVVYREMFYRHVHNNRDCFPTVQDRVAAFKNYIELFNIFLKQSESEPKLDLPQPWLWDIVNDFVLQKFAFDEWVATADQEDLAQIAGERDPIWSMPIVLQYLHALVNKGRVPLKLNPAVSPTDAGGDTGFGIANSTRTMAHFALICLAHVHMRLGDYQTAIDTLEPIDSRKRSQVAKMYSCFSTLHYTMALSFVMLHRFMEAIRVSAALISYSQNTKAFAAHRAWEMTQGFGARTPFHDQTLALLAIAYAVCPNARIDDSVLSTVKDEYGDEISEMDAGSTDVFRRLFDFASPPALGDAVEQRSHRLSIFLKEVTQRQALNGIDLFLKLYTTISVDKLASALNMDAVSVLQQLLALKQRNRMIQEGHADITSSDVDFQICGDTVHVQYSKAPRGHTDFFLRNTYKLNELARDIERM